MTALPTPPHAPPAAPGPESGLETEPEAGLEAGPWTLEALLYGTHPLPRIVAVEPSGGNAVTLYRRDERGGIVAERDTFQPWLVITQGDVRHLPPGERQVVPLAGPGELNRLVLFPRWGACTNAQAALRAAGASFFAFPSAVAQYLTLSGRTLFHDMRFEDVHRLQIDVETATLRAGAGGAAVLLVALTDNHGHEEVLSARDGGEAELLRRVSARIAELDPDLIEGHNLIDFDLPYLATRAEQLGLRLNWGRDGQPIWLEAREGRLKVGARLLPSMRIHIHGRHVLDTYQQIQRFDSEGKLESYALKPVIEALELVRPDREFVDRTQIGDLWERDPARLARYCLDDARDVRTLSDLITPTEFYQTQIVPRSFQDVATGGTGEKVNALLVRAYVTCGRALPLPQPPRPYPGGYSELREAGVFHHVVKCDVESLYPAVMLRYEYKPASDALEVFLPLLNDLTRRRLDAKRQIRRVRGPERAYWTGLSSSYKVLVNCFTPGHQVLTPEGFRLVEALRVGDLVYSLNPTTGAVEQKPVTHTWAYDYDGPVIAYRHDNVDCEVTPNHHFILEDRRGRRVFREAWELPALNNHSLPPIPPLVAGDVRDPEGIDVALHRFLMEQCVKGAANKRLPPWVFTLSRQSLRLVWLTLLKGDGDKEHPRFTTKSPQLADDFCRLCYLLGHKVTVGFDGCYRIWVKRERRVSLRRRRDHFQVRRHTGKVCCVTVADNHTLLAGRNYKLNWVGQSFYGYLGYARANFNDFGAAEAVTTTGQRLIKEVLAALEARGCQIIEVDTDGVYFVPPPEVATEAQELRFVEEIGRVLPKGINLAHDGRYAGMVSLKQKTYFLRTYDGRLIAKGSSLRSRRDERYLREFVQRAAVTLVDGTLVDGTLAEVSEQYLALAETIQEGRLPVEAFTRRESITAKTHTSPGLRRLAAAAKGVPVGQQVQVYQREDGSLALASEYRGDEDRDYLLRRLHDMARRFEGLCQNADEFKRLFPRLVAKREPTPERPVQLSLFE